MNDSEKNKYLVSIYPELFGVGGVTRTLTVIRGEVIDCYCQDRNGTKYPINREQCQTIYPDKIMSDDYGDMDFG
tara:strand:+ start:169 stop:390 length:222 start_codon:yes stop_codon:yes gene_type:complete